MAGSRRRSNGEGSIFKLPNGRWRVQAEVPQNGPSRKRRRVVRHFNSRMEAVAGLRAIQAEMTGFLATKATVGRHLLDWLERGEWAPSTCALYGNAIRKHLIPSLGAVNLSDLKPLQIDNWLRNSTAGDRTKQVCFDVLRLALTHGVHMEILSRNPTDKVERPRAKREEIRPFTPAEVVHILKATDGTRWHAAVVLGLSCGLRQGELFGLRWASVELRHAFLTISEQATDVSGKVHIRQPKTDAGRRTIALPKIAVDALSDHLAIQMREGLAGSELVFPAPRGGIARRGLFRTRFWVPLLAGLGIDHRGAHHLRHTYATFALGAGVPVHVVSQVLGHTKNSTTLDLYAKALPTQQAEAAAIMQRLLG